jgi:hypothetical protein
MTSITEAMNSSAKQVNTSWRHDSRPVAVIGEGTAG